MKLNLTYPLLVVVLAATGPAFAQRSIFDEDWMPPARPETRQPQPEKPTSRPADAPSSPMFQPPVKTPLNPAPRPNPMPRPDTTPRPPVTVTAPSPPPPPPIAVVRRAVPGPEDQAPVRKMMKELFGDQLTDRSPTARRTLTESLLREAEKVADVPVDQFVLLAAAIDAAIDGQSLPLAFRAADRMAKGFVVDAGAIKVEAVVAMKPAVTPDATTENIRAALELATELARADDIYAAIRVCVAAQPLAASSLPWRAQVQKRLEELNAAREASERIATIRETLKTSPDDAEANLAVGRYVCFITEDWKTGLPMLAKGSDPALKALAAQELDAAATNTPDAINRIADGWWDLAVAMGDVPGQASVRAHAVGYYERTVSTATGLRRTQIEKRIAEAHKPPDPIPDPVGAGPANLLHKMKTSAMREQGIVMLKRGETVVSPDNFKPPVAFKIVTRNDGGEFRIGHASTEIIFNYDRNPQELRINGGPAAGQHKMGAGRALSRTWVTIDLVVKADSMTISVDGRMRHSVKADFSRTDDKLTIWSRTAPLQVKSVQVTRPPE